MKYEIVVLEELSGDEATIYSIIENDSEKTLFDEFIDKHLKTHKKEIEDIVNRLYLIGTNTGARDSFFKHFEGKYGDFVCALYDQPDKHLRLYCIRLGTTVVILGGGAPKNVQKWQDDPELSNAAEKMIKYSADIAKHQMNKDLYWSTDKKELEGKFKYGYDEGEET